MHRIDSSLRSVDKFGAGQDGFTAGNELTGTLATQCSPEWLDEGQEELAEAIEATGAVLAKGATDQFYGVLGELLAVPFMYGDGSDGDVIISGNTTLTRDMHYTNLTVDSGFTISTAGFRIFCTGTLINNGTIIKGGGSGGNGGNGVGAVGGTGGTGGYAAIGVTVPGGGSAGATGGDGDDSLGQDGNDAAAATGEGDEFAPGTELKVDQFETGQHVDVVGTSKGKGYAGTVKRHHFRTQDNTHGNSVSHRVPGSIGQNQTPGRVFKGKKMSGHLGNVKRTAANLEVVRVDEGRNLILVKGAVPGAANGRVIVRPATKAL